MPVNFDGTSAELQPNKNTDYVNNSKNKENTSNEEQISEKEEQKKKKPWADYPFTDHKKINLNRRFRIEPYRQQEGEEQIETTYGRFIHW